MKTLPRVAGEMALHVLAYNLTRVINIVGSQVADRSDQGLRSGRHHVHPRRQTGQDGGTTHQSPLLRATNRNSGLAATDNRAAPFSEAFLHDQDPKRSST